VRCSVPELCTHVMMPAPPWGGCPGCALNAAGRPCTALRRPPQHQHSAHSRTCGRAHARAHTGLLACLFCCVLPTPWPTCTCARARIHAHTHTPACTYTQKHTCACSDRVAGAGCFGATLMLEPELVGDCMRAMGEAASEWHTRTL